jgi:hypothetical protein
MQIKTAVIRATQSNPEITEDLLREALAGIQGVAPNYIESCTDKELELAITSLAGEPQSVVSANAMALPESANDAIEIQDASPSKGAMAQVAETLSRGAADLRVSASEAGAALADEVAVQYAAAFASQLDSNATALQTAFESLTGSVFGSGDQAGTAGKEVIERRQRSANSLNQFLM